jgi:hypothetical protein
MSRDPMTVMFGPKSCRKCGRDHYKGECPQSAEARAKAWATRREKYGERGHSGSYRRASHPLETRALRLVLRLHEEGTLSEGQCCKALDLDRVDFRALVDAARHPTGTEAPSQSGEADAAMSATDEQQNPTVAEGGRR